MEENATEVYGFNGQKGFVLPRTIQDWLQYRGKQIQRANNAKKRLDQEAGFRVAGLRHPFTEGGQHE